jgi:2-hydroxycyclohexanecarboxyl-CoA dehydrogenase
VDLGLSGEVAVVLGAAQGIGRAIACAFAREGAAVTLLDRDPGVNAVADQIEQECGSATLGIVADVTDYERVRQAEAAVRSRFGRCDHVVFAVGLGSGKVGFPFWNLEPGDWERVLRVNLLGAVHAAHAFAPGLAQAGYGTLLFLTSVAGQIGSQTDPPYSAAKAGLINFAQCAARDLAPYGVRVNALAPGMVKTDLNRSVWAAWNAQQPEGERLSYEAWGDEKVRRVSPLGRWQEPEEIAAMAVYLASRHARNITGQTLNVDGGQVMHS